MRERAMVWWASVLAACGGDAPPDPNDCPIRGGETCFRLPTAPMTISSASAMPPLLDCGEVAPVAARQPFTLTGRVYDYQFGPYYTVPGANVELFASASFVSPIATLVTDDLGNYSVALPVGTPDVLYAHVTASIITDEYLHAFRPTNTLSPDILTFNLASTNPGFLDDTARLVRVSRDPEAGFAVVTVSDCGGRPIEHIEVVLSSERGTRAFLDGASTVYGTPGSMPVPVLVTARSDTADNGMAAIINIPPNGDYYLQAWGFPTMDEVTRGEPGLALVMEVPVGIDASTAYGITYRANVPLEP
jgi:hypothetical protein